MRQYAASIQARADARPFDIIVLGGGSFGGVLAQHLFHDDRTHSHRILVLEGGPFLLPEHVQNLPLLGLNSPAPSRTKLGPHAEIWELPWQTDVQRGFPVHLHWQAAGLGQKYLITCKGGAMSDLVAVGFNDTMKADEVLWRLRTLQSEDLVDLEDAVVVIRDQSGKIQLKQSVDLAGAQTSAGLIAGTFLGGLIGMLFLNPTAGFLLGGMFGASAGALSGSLADYGIDDDFIESLAETIPNNSSALFVLARKARLDKVLAALSDVGGKVLKTSLSPDQEKRLRETLEGSAKSAGTTATLPSRSFSNH